MSTLSALYGAKTVIVGKFFVTLPKPVGHAGLAEQTIIVTGANSGLGFETSLHLSRLGVGKLIMAVRTIAKGEEAKMKILGITRQPESSIEIWPIDMDSYDSIKTFAARVAQLPRIDGVLANAGVMTTKYSLSEGSEKTLNVNVIGTFLLYLLLLPTMRLSAQKTGYTCRFVIPNSGLHYAAPIAELGTGDENMITRLNDAKRADMTGRYPLSKLLALYCVRELAERSKASGKGKCILNTPNPSFCKSNLADEMQGSAGFRLFERTMARSTEEGSRVLVHGLFAGGETSGQYLSNCQIEIPARHVTNKWGQQVQKKFVDELLEKLEEIQPGISANI